MKNKIYKRILSSIILLPITLFLIIKGTFFFNILLFIFLLVSIFEWHMMSKKKPYYLIGNFFLLFSFYCIYSLRNNLGENSLFIFLFITLVCISTDIGGYIFGNIFKGPKLTKISPKKTYSGVFGGYLLSLIVSYSLIDFSFLLIDKKLNFGITELIFFLLISSVSQMGDIIISYFKRLSKIKDTGKLIPGHGGILDRIDGMIFAFLFVYFINSFTNFL